MYEERLFSKRAVGSSAAVIIVVIIVALPLLGWGSHPYWLSPVVFLVGLGAVAYFARLVIRITPQFIAVSRGFIRHTVRWENVEDCYVDESSAVSYGYGISMARVNGRWRLVFSLTESPRVVLSLRTGVFREFAFSTNNPQEVIRLVKERITR